MILTVLCLFSTWGVLAQSVPAEQGWVDENHQVAKTALHGAANEMNTWFGTPKAHEPAAAQLRVIVDNYWNKHDGYSIKPRLRGKIKLPTLKERLNIVFGDDSIDDELNNDGDIAANKTTPIPQNKKIDLHQARRENSSIGLQWEVPSENYSAKTRFSLGLRSRGDLYAKIKTSQNWYYGEDFRVRGELIYRYGIRSKHQVRANLGLDYATSAGVINSNQFHLEYRKKDIDEWTWGNALSRKHLIGDDAWIQYGVYMGGEISHGGDVSLNTYGPFVGARHSVYRDWLFVQPELTYYNDKAENEGHHTGVMLRLEAIF